MLICVCMFPCRRSTGGLCGSVACGVPEEAGSDSPFPASVSRRASGMSQPGLQHWESVG